MLSSGDAEMPSACTVGGGEERILRIHQPADPLLSPSIQRMPGESIAAFELKFVISEFTARQVEAWAEGHMQRDAFADLRHGGSYQTTTLYLDTPQLDVFHRSPSYRRRKLRVRRYGSEPTLYLERKARWGDRVKKRRCDVPLEGLVQLAAGVRDSDTIGERRSDSNGERRSVSATWPGQWFVDWMAKRGLQPACRVTYDRTAFVAGSANGPLRLTLDRQLRGVAAQGWEITPVNGEGHRILADEVVCEFKFRQLMPDSFKQIIAALGLQPGSMSKYRRILSAAGVVEQPRSASA